MYCNFSNSCIIFLYAAIPASTGLNATMSVSTSLNATMPTCTCLDAAITSLKAKENNVNT